MCCSRPAPANASARKLLDGYNFHTLLRLPTGIFYKQGGQGERAVLRPPAGRGDAVDA
jgi:hypothetical protein